MNLNSYIEYLNDSLRSPLDFDRQYEIAQINDFSARRTLGKIVEKYTVLMDEREIKGLIRELGKEMRARKEAYELSLARG